MPLLPTYATTKPARRTIGAAQQDGSPLLGLSVERPAIGVYVMTVNGELDMFTALRTARRLQQPPSHYLYRPTRHRVLTVDVTAGGEAVFTDR